MKINLTILFLLLSSLAIAQKKITVTATGGTNYMFIQNSQNTENTQSGEFAYQSGLELSYKVFNNFKIGIGGIWSTASSVEIFKKIPGDDIFNYDTYVNHTLRYMEFPLFIRYDLFNHKKNMPYVNLGISSVKISELEDKVIKTDPAGQETDFWTQIYNYTFKNETMYLTNMRILFAGIGSEYKLGDSFTIGIGTEVKRFSYYAFDTKKNYYTLTGNLRISYLF